MLADELASFDGRRSWPSRGLRVSAHQHANISEPVLIRDQADGDAICSRRMRWPGPGRGEPRHGGRTRRATGEEACPSFTSEPERLGPPH
jgi:hypothetical protein